MGASRYSRWCIGVAMGVAAAILALEDAGSAASGKGAASAVAKDRETHRLLTQSPPDWAQLLLSQGANIEARNLHQETPLITSAGQGNLPLVELLLQKHADIQAADTDGNTPLHIASFNGRVKVVELLLNNGAQTRVQNSLGFSPLHQAVRRFWEIPGETEAGRLENQRQIILLLLAHDADPDLEDGSHRTAPVLATENNNGSLAALFDARSMTGGAQAAAASSAPSNLPRQQVPIDMPPRHEPEAPQQVDRTPASETPHETDSAKRETELPEPEPIPPSSGSETGIVRPPDRNPLETLPSQLSQSSVTPSDVPESSAESTAKPVEPSTSAADAGPSESTTQPASSPSPPEEPQPAASAVPDRERSRPSQSMTPHESAPAERMGSERPPIPGLSLQTPSTPPDTTPPAAPILPPQTSGAGIPHTKALPDLPKQRNPDSPGASPPPAVLPPKRQDEIGALAQAPHPHPREPIPKSGPDMPPPPPGPVPGYPVKEPPQLEGRNGNRDREQAPTNELSDNWILRNLGFGLGIGWTHNLGPERIESATAVNRIVRVDADQNDLIRFMPEVHLWLDQWWDDQRWNWGPFFSLAPGANLIDAVGFGLMLGYRPHPTDRYTFNLGIGGTLDFDTRVLGDGLAANQPLPRGENQVRTKQTTATGLLIMFSVGWDIGMPRRAPPQQAP